MPQHHRPGAFSPQDQFHFKSNFYQERMEPGVEFAQLFDPSFWLHGKRKLKQHDLVRCIANDETFDVVLTVRSVAAGGVVMRFLYGDPGPSIDNPLLAVSEIRSQNIEPKIVPRRKDGTLVVRAEYIPTTKWRIIGLNGEEVVRDIEDKTKAEERLQAYLKEINMRFPTDEETKSEAAESAEVA